MTLEFPKFCLKTTDSPRGAVFGCDLTIKLSRNLEKEGVSMKGLDSYKSKEKRTMEARKELSTFLPEQRKY